MKRPRVLIADDEPAIRQLLNAILSDDYDVVGTAPDGHTLITAALQLQPDLIITDIEMRGKDGIEATRELTWLMPRTKVLILTSHADQEHTSAAYDAGAAAYVVKGGQPDFPAHISLAIESLLRQPECDGRPRAVGHA